MIPLWLTVERHTASILGRAPKIVSCEGCSTEYVYIIERESTGSEYSTGFMGVMPFFSDNRSAKTRVEASAKEGLKGLLEEEFDAVPCPLCGHYQKHMFAKLEPPKSDWHSTWMLVTIVVGLLALLPALKYTLQFFDAQGNSGHFEMLAFWGAFLAMVLAYAGLSRLDQRRISRFNPNTAADQDARIAIGKSRAITKVEYDAIQHERTIQAAFSTSGERTVAEPDGERDGGESESPSTT
jgi:hypothetical protein